MSNMKSAKRFSLVLHAHLPHVLNHGRWPHGADWLSEVACETYLPLIKTIEDLLAEGIKPRITIGLTPILCEQLSSDVFREEFPRFLEIRQAAALKDLDQFAPSKDKKQLASLAVMWAGYYEDSLRQFRELNYDIVGAFKHLEDAGAIEIMGSAATHGYLPLLYNDERVREQIHVGLETHQKHFGHKPAGFWLPECAYRPGGHWQRPVDDGGETSRAGIEEMLAAEGIEYFIVDSHLVTQGIPLGAYKQLMTREGGPDIPEEKTSGKPTHHPYLVGKGPVSCFVRDAACGMQVWSGEHGYPGDAAYLEFHKRHWPGGMRYWRITSADKDLGTKQPYDPLVVEEMASQQAWHFVGLVKWVLREGGMVCAPYDAELFGHWWHEGPVWIRETFRLLAADEDLKAVTPSEDLLEHPPGTCIALPAGSWGDGGGDDVWLNDDNSWIWETLYSLAERLSGISASHKTGDKRELDRIMEIARRQMLLAEASDWPFLITTGNVKDYAEKRFREHASAVGEVLDIYERTRQSGKFAVEDKITVDRLDKDDFPFSGLL